MVSAFISPIAQMYLSWEEPLVVDVFSLKCICTFASTSMIFFALNHFSNLFEIQSTLHTVHRNLCDAFYQLESETTDSVADGS